jgi:hypothetical protein
MVVPRYTGVTDVPVVKIHGFGTPPVVASGLPVRFVAPDVMLAVYWVLGRRLVVGVKVAIKLIGS